METRSLPCKLTDDEKRLRGEAIAKKIREWEEVELARKAAASDAKAKQEAIDAEIKMLASVIRTGSEDRDIEVREIRNDAEFKMDTVRCDTGEVIDSRPLRRDELQASLFDIASHRAKKKKTGGGEDGGDGGAN